MFPLVVVVCLWVSRQGIWISFPLFGKCCFVKRIGGLREKLPANQTTNQPATYSTIACPYKQFHPTRHLHSHTHQGLFRQTFRSCCYYRIPRSSPCSVWVLALWPNDWFVGDTNYCIGWRAIKLPNPVQPGHNIPRMMEMTDDFKDIQWWAVNALNIRWMMRVSFDEWRMSVGCLGWQWLWWIAIK